MLIKDGKHKKIVKTILIKKATINRGVVIGEEKITHLDSNSQHNKLNKK